SAGQEGDRSFGLWQQNARSASSDDEATGTQSNEQAGQRFMSDPRFAATVAASQLAALRSDVQDPVTAMLLYYNPNRACEANWSINSIEAVWDLTARYLPHPELPPQQGGLQAVQRRIIDTAASWKGVPYAIPPTLQK